MAEKTGHYKSTLKVNKGIEQPSSFNPEAAGKIQESQTELFSAETLMKGIINRNRMLLSKAITLVESSLLKHQEIAQDLIQKCLPHTGHSIRIGITGVPGVGKSTFIEALGLYLTSRGHQLAVLAIDPSSERTKGSILGDKTRMEQLANNPNAFIRPSPSAGSLGGVARKTKEIIVLCEAAGFDTIFVETVGVGQSETAVHSMVDFFLLLMLAGAGDELQGIKRGIMEMADALIINKADGDNLQKATLSMAEYTNALHLFPPNPSGWSPRVGICSAKEKSGIETIWNMVETYRDITQKNGYFERKRQEQELKMLFEHINNNLKDRFYNHPAVTRQLKQAEQDVISGNLSAYQAAAALLKSFYENL